MLKENVNNNNERSLLKVVALPIIAICLAIISFTIVNLNNFFTIPTIAMADTEKYREIQRRLRDWGYYDGPITGEIGPLTTEAIKYFQREHGISPTGQIDGATSQALGVYINSQGSNDLYLIAKCVYAEARGEPYEGKVAVAAVILNRVKDPDFPNTVYGVIYQPWAFTAVHDGQINLEPDASAYQAAQDAINGWDPSYGCIYYYNPAVATSKWIFSRQTVVTIGKHVFAI